MFSVSSCSELKHKTTIAVVVDKHSYNQAKLEINSYISTISSSGKEIIILIDSIGNPKHIKSKLFDLYQKSNLEGAVFIGDIPIPMIRNAQHLTTAFKMDQTRDWKDSSVPSDRYYDDFDLKFDYLNQDSLKPLYHYFSLRSDSKHSIDCDIYSGRIKAPIINGKDKYELLRAYLKKVTSEKSSKRGISKVLHFAGHGYNSNSMNARIDEAMALYNHFPLLNSRQGFDLEYIDHTFQQNIRGQLLSSLSHANLDLAILHHHGSEDVQYLNGTPKTVTPDKWIDQIKNFMRSKIRNAKDPKETQKYYVDRYEVPKQWISDSFDKAMIEKDSIYAAEKDITTKDLDGIKINSAFVLLDACYNGSFHMDDYIAGRYIFNEGRCIATKANSVNTLQDTWTNELVGLLDCNISIGNWSKGQMTLESHILGDPTFVFAPNYGGLKVDDNLDNAISLKRDDDEFWRNLLKTTSHSDVKALAVKMLARIGKISSQELLTILSSDTSPIIRMSAFMRLKERADDCLYEALVLGMNDSYELLQRLSTMIAAKNADPRLGEIAVKKYLDPLQSQRVSFQNDNLLSALDAENVIKLINTHVAKDHKLSDQLSIKDFEYRIGLIKRRSEMYAEDVKNVSDKTISERKRNFVVKAQRNLCRLDVIDSFFKILSDKDESDQMRIKVIESLGWYRYSCEKSKIIDFCQKALQNEDSELIKDELTKTINRLQ